MNVFIAVIYENFSDIQASEDENDILSLKKKDIKAFQNTWAKYGLGVEGVQALSYVLTKKQAMH